MTVTPRNDLKGMELVPGLESLAIPTQEREAVLGSVAQAQQRGSQLGVNVNAVHLCQVLGSNDPRRFTDEDSACVMGWFYLRVTCDGRVMFCCKDKQVGHLDEASLYRIWRSPTYHLHRLAGRDGEPDPEIFDEKCRACSNFERNRQALERLRG